MCANGVPIMFVEGELREMSGRVVRSPDILMMPGGGDLECTRDDEADFEASLTWLLLSCCSGSAKTLCSAFVSTGGGCCRDRSCTGILVSKREDQTWICPHQHSAQTV